MNRNTAIAVLSLTLTIAPMWAAANHPGHLENTLVVSGDMSQGEVRKIDKGAGKITLKHSELKNLQMPAMSMVFRVKDPAMLEQVKVGDQVHFVAEKVGGQFTLTRIEPKQ